MDNIPRPLSHLSQTKNKNNRNKLYSYQENQKASMPFLFITDCLKIIGGRSRRNNLLPVNLRQGKVHLRPVPHNALPRQQQLLGLEPSGKTRQRTIVPDHPMTGNLRCIRVAVQCLPHGTRGFRTAKPTGQLAISRHLAPWYSAADAPDPLIPTHRSGKAASKNIQQEISVHHRFGTFHPAFHMIDDSPPLTAHSTIQAASRRC